MSEAAQNSDPEQQKLRQEAEREKEERLRMRHLRMKHPDCIPVYFVKHKEASQSLKDPTTAFMLFKKDLQIQQAMYRLYEQIQQKGLYFFCLNNNPQQKAKYIRLQPGPTIEKIFSRYGRNDYLILIYADSQLGMQGFRKMQKCLMWVLIVLATVWAVLFGYSYYQNWQAEPVGQSPLPPTPEAPNSEWMQDIN